MAHVTASLNRLYQSDLTTLGTARKQSTTSTTAATSAATSATGATTSGAATSGTSTSGESDFQLLFSSQTSSSETTSATPAATPAAAPEAAPTPESVFGASPWLSNPTGTNPDGSTFSYNPLYFATPQAAAQVAQMLGGTVVSSNEFTSVGSPFVQQQPNLMVQMPNGSLVNAGLVASFYTHGYPQSYINTLLHNVINGSNC
jgi:hypothetical protein